MVAFWSLCRCGLRPIEGSVSVVRAVRLARLGFRRFSPVLVFDEGRVLLEFWDGLLFRFHLGVTVLPRRWWRPGW